VRTWNPANVGDALIWKPHKLRWLPHTLVRQR
jgi:hypothetical protein